MMQFFKRWTQALKNERGYVSLTEAAATTAIGLTLAAVAAPVIINVGDDAKASRSRQDTVAIQQSISKFVADVGEFPIRGGVGGGVGIQVVMPSNKVAAESDHLEAVNCERTGDTATNDPILTVESDCASLSGVGNNLNNHLAFDKLSTLSLGYAEGKDGVTPKRNWNGPYIKELQTDPWGRNYIVYTRGMHQSVSGTSKAQTYAWILSAGPDGVLQTTKLDSKVQGDDIGTLAAVLNAPDANFVSSTK